MQHIIFLTEAESKLELDLFKNPSYFCRKDNFTGQNVTMISEFHRQTPFHIFTDCFPLSAGRLYNSIENTSTSPAIRYIFASSTSNKKQNESNQHHPDPDLNRNVSFFSEHDVCINRRSIKGNEQ